ncbi:MAG: winged helix-turn-helix transcriptional regulator [Nitriliruptorales bacterium]
MCQTRVVKTYGQYCPIARGSEILAERWTPIILRNLHLGCHTFNAIAAGAPGLSRALLTKRLRELERADVLAIFPKPDGHGSFYELTDAGRDAWRVLKALGQWGDRWTEVLDEHAHVGIILWSWCEEYVRRDALPDKRGVVRFDHRGRQGKATKDWLLIEHRTIELCRFDPGFDDVVVAIEDPIAFARWHLGLLDWATAIRTGGIQLSGDRQLCRALPTWNAAPEIHNKRRATAAT